MALILCVCDMSLKYNVINMVSTIQHCPDQPKKLYLKIGKMYNMKKNTCNKLNIWYMCLSIFMDILTLCFCDVNMSVDGQDVEAFKIVQNYTQIHLKIKRCKGKWFN